MIKDLKTFQCKTKDTVLKEAVWNRVHFRQMYGGRQTKKEGIKDKGER